MAKEFFMNRFIEQKSELNDLIGMIGSIAALDFTKRLKVDINEDPTTVIAYGLNMLSEELEANVVKRSLLEEVNHNLDQFAHILAHDIKSPLGIALGLISIIESELAVEKNEVLREYFPALKEALGRIDRMILGILEYSRISFDKVKVSELSIGKICNELCALCPIGQKPEVSIAPDIPMICFNETAMRQIFQNLIDNAVKHNDKPVCRIVVSCSEEADVYRISVQDNGPGIAEDRLGLVFDWFENFRSANTQSHGVGLSIVKKLVEQAGGSISVSSVPGQGTRFSFTVSRHFAVGKTRIEQIT
ncbi:MAG TPA: HAMP domain-containing sensor histidine kinase [Chitinophagaceae bacterium]|nr:HAMP domain-containing sensor histidine kinase [Chitinophagaceae bacterium]